MEESFLDNICLDREMEEGFLDDICLLASHMYEETQRDFLDDDFLLVAVGFNKKRRVLPIYSVELKQSLRFANLKAKVLYHQQQGNLQNGPQPFGKIQTGRRIDQN